jgi:hypothetical protein
MKTPGATLTTVLALVGGLLCASAANAAPTETPSVAALARQIAEQKKEIDDLKKSVMKLQFENSIQEAKYQTVYFDPMIEGFQRIDANFGSFAVSLADVEAYGDGVRVKVSLGNLSAADFSGVKLALRYGRRQPNVTVGNENWASSYQAWDASLQSKEHAVVSRVEAGSWNPIPVILPGIEPKDFGFLEIRITTNTVHLR